MILFSLLCFVGLSVAQICEPGWENYGNPSSGCVAIFDLKYNFTDALKYCQSYENGSLVSIHNAYQNKQIMEMAYKLSYTAKFYIGLHKSVKHEWTDGSYVNYINWGTNNTIPNIPSAAYITPKTGYVWFPTSDLSEENYFVCERVPYVEYNVGPCADYPDGVEFNGACYFGNRYADGWLNSEDACGWPNKHLVSIHSQEEQDFLYEHFKYPFWTGLRRSRDSEWFWSDWTSYDFTAVSNNLDMSFETMVCVMNVDNQWVAQECDNYCQYDCKYDPNLTPTTVPVLNCDNGYVFNDHCYFASIEQNSASYGYLWCWALYSNLVSIHSQEEQDFLNQHFEYEYFIGLPYYNVPCEWVDGTRCDYQNWASNETGSTLGVQNTKNGWVTAPDEARLKGVCKRKVNKIVPPSPYLYSCLEVDNKYQYNGYCYSVSNIPDYIVSIHSQEEQDFIDKTFRNDYLIGLHPCEENNNSWCWYDNSTVDYLNWSPTVPHNTSDRILNLIDGWGYMNASYPNSIKKFPVVNPVTLPAQPPPPTPYQPTTPSLSSTVFINISMLLIFTIFLFL